MKRQMLAVGALVAVAGAALAAAPGPEEPRRERRNFKQELGLTDAQQQELRQIRTEHKKWAITHEAKVRVARLELDELMAASTIDEKAVAGKTKELGDLQVAGLKARVDHRMAVAKVLTPEQRQKMRNRPRFDGPRHRGMRGPRGPHRRGPEGRGRGVGDGPAMGAPGPLADNDDVTVSGEAEL